jgi:putrescine---pyruvate transaminase
MSTNVIAPPAIVSKAHAVDTKAVQALDSAHYIHAFTDHGELATRGARVMTHADGIYVWDSEGKKVLDGMSGLWCVNAGYGRKEIADAAYQQMMTLPYYNSFFQTTNVPAAKLAAKLAVTAASTTCSIHPAAARATTPTCAWCAATGTCWANPSARPSLAA